MRRAASPAAVADAFPALSQLRAPLHNKIYFKTQLKETGRLHVTVPLTYPAPAPNREAPSDSRGDSEARELGRKKIHIHIYKRGGGEGLGREEGRGAPCSPAPASSPGLQPRPPPRPATAWGAWIAAPRPLRAICGRCAPRRPAHTGSSRTQVFFFFFLFISLIQMMEFSQRLS